METFKMSSSNGMGLGYSLPPQGNYHGQLFEFLADNLADPIIYYWHDGIEKWIPLLVGSGGSSGGSGGSSGGSGDGGIVWDSFNL